MGTWFFILNGDSQSKIWNIWTTLNPNHGFHGNQSCVKRSIFGQAFRKSLLEWILRRVTGFLLGGGTMCPPPPLVFGAQKKPGLDRVKEEDTLLPKLNLLAAEEVCIHVKLHSLPKTFVTKTTWKRTHHVKICMQCSQQTCKEFWNLIRVTKT